MEQLREEHWPYTLWLPVGNSNFFSSVTVHHLPRTRTSCTWTTFFCLFLCQLIHTKAVFRYEPRKMPWDFGLDIFSELFLSSLKNTAGVYPGQTRLWMFRTFSSQGLNLACSWHFVRGAGRTSSWGNWVWHLSSLINPPSEKTSGKVQSSVHVWKRLN